MELGITAKDLPKIWLFLLLSCCSHCHFAHLITCPTVCRCHPEGQIICQNRWFDGPLNPYLFRVVRNASVQLEIHMDHNKITHIPKRVFENFSSLRNLNLNDNYIKTLDPEAFYGLRQLRFLDMRNNSITELPIGLFAQQVRLVSLDLRQNKIGLIQFETISPLVSLEQLALGDNPLICDCKMKQILEWVTSRNVSEGDPLISCMVPRVMARAPWIYLFHLCPAVTKNRTDTTTLSNLLITSTTSSSEAPSGKPETTFEFSEETVLTTHNSLYNPTPGSATHDVSATPRVKNIKNVDNRTASADVDKTHETIIFVVVATVLIILSVFVFVMCRQKQKRTRFKLMKDENTASVPPPGRGEELLCDNDVDDEEEGYEYVDLGKNSNTARYVSSVNQENGVPKNKPYI